MVNPVVWGKVEDKTKGTQVANLWVENEEQQVKSQGLSDDSHQLGVDPKLVEKVQLRVHLSFFVAHSLPNRVRIPYGW